MDLSKVLKPLISLHCSVFYSCNLVISIDTQKIDVPTFNVDVLNTLAINVYTSIRVDLGMAKNIPR